ncbi:MAG: hypothetical protein ACQER9_02440 [Nanobdellota archaeon]
MFSLQLNLNNFNEVERIKEEMKCNFDNVKNELDEHLESINQNSIEVQSNYDYLEELNKKIDKLEEKMDNVCYMMKNFMHNKTEVNSEEISESEKEIFLVLYTSNQPLSIEEISLRSSLPVHVVEDTIESLMIKKYPINKKNFADKNFLYLAKNYKDNMNGISKKILN